MLVSIAILAYVTSSLFGAMIKDNVDLSGIQPETLIGIQETREVFREHDYPFVITDISRHRGSGLHRVGFAWDTRVRDPGGKWSIPESERYIMASEIQDRVGSQYDVIYEDEIKDVRAPHIHGEFQPK